MSSPIAMSTPINNIPLKTTNDNKEDDSNDPLVQDVLKEFENEILSQKKNDIPQQPIHQQQYQPPPQIIHQQPIQQQPIPQQQNIKNYINIDFIKKSVIIIIIIYLISYSNIISYLYNLIPSKFYNLFIENDIYIKLLLIFISIYILYFNNIL